MRDGIFYPSSRQNVSTLRHSVLLHLPFVDLSKRFYYLHFCFRCRQYLPVNDLVTDNPKKL